jgi:GT2 family glycosyltransferase
MVDDASPVPAKCNEAKIIRIEQKDKWWHNPCIPFNMAFKEAKGDVVIIQNPECIHMEDVLSYVHENIRDGLYLSFGCYAINEEETNKLRSGVYPNIYDKAFGLNTRNGWYNHATFRPVGYHFCTAITKSDLDKVGGFDERYAHGISYDDDDLVYRINDKNIEIKIVNHPFVIHQYHAPFTYMREGWQKLHTINKNLFKSLWL